MYVIGWSFWFDDGTEWPVRYDHTQEPESFPKEGCLAGVALFADGTRRSIQGSEIYGVWRHPCGEPVFLQYGSGQMAPHEVEQALESVARWYPGAALWLGRNTADVIQKRAADAAMAWTVD